MHRHHPTTKLTFTCSELLLAVASCHACAKPLQVGSVNNTFGIQGVREHCQFFKTIEDATRLRKRISECFERAALPNVSCAQLQLAIHIDTAAFCFINSCTAQGQAHSATKRELLCVHIALQSCITLGAWTAALAHHHVLRACSAAKHELAMPIAA
jgi:hypothetical protein